MDPKLSLAGIFSLLLVLYHVEGFSRVPTEFAGSTWYSNVHGQVLFTNTEVQNWRVNIPGQSTLTWLIVDDTRFNSTGGYIIFRSSSNYTITGTNFFAYMCVNLYSIQENLYTYHSLHATESRFGNERVLLLESGCIEYFQNVCDMKFVPNADDIHILARKGSDNFRSCPDQLRTQIGFTAQSTDSTNLCVGLTNQLNGCPDATKIQVTSACGYPLVFSANGSLSCLTEQASGNDGVIYLLNMDDTVDDVNTFRFSCMVLSSDGTIMSVVPQRCMSGHTSTTFPVSTTIGQRLFLKTKAACQTNVRTVYDQTNSLWIKIGIPVGIVVLFIIVIIIVMFIVCSRIRRKQMSAEREKADGHKNGKLPPKRQIVYIQKVPAELVKDMGPKIEFPGKMNAIEYPKKTDTKL